MIDLSTLKKGDTVKIRCGGEAVVSEIHISHTGNFNITVNDSCYSLSWYKDGTKILNMDWLDIIEIIPAPFDWDTVEQGMAFEYKGDISDGIVYYIGKHLTDNSRVVIYCRHANNFETIYDGVSIKNLTRAPEHDMELKS